MLPSKFGVNLPFGSGEEAKIDFQDGGHSGHLGFLIGMILAIFDLHPDASYQVSSQLAQGCRRSRLLNQLLTPHDGQRTTPDGRRTTDDGH